MHTIMIENNAVAVCRNNCQIRAHRFDAIFHIIILRDVYVRTRRNNVGVQDDRLCAMSRVYNNIRSRRRRRRRRYPDRKKNIKGICSSRPDEKRWRRLCAAGKPWKIRNIGAAAVPVSRDVINKTLCTDNLSYIERERKKERGTCEVYHWRRRRRLKSNARRKYKNFNRTLSTTKHTRQPSFNVTTADGPLSPIHVSHTPASTACTFTESIRFYTNSHACVCIAACNRT